MLTLFLFYSRLIVSPTKVKAMNSVNSDLEFTTEVQENFAKERLPKLDFKLWIEKETGKINHSYFQKTMKTPLILILMGSG